MAVDFLAGAQRLGEQLTAWRRDFHRHPELAFQETRTAALVAETLGRLGLEVQTGVGQTGVVGILNGATTGPAVLVRCDMDALPIAEETSAEYSSIRPGMMHACGHDGHTAIGLAVAHLLHEQHAHLHGCVKFVFQPAEEVALGAQAMINDGVLGDPSPDVTLGLHLWNYLPVGQVGLTAGPMMAGAALFEIVVHGQGGHAAIPHDARDPLLAGAQIVTALQSIVSRNVDPLETAVISVTSFQAGEAFNVIPECAWLKGTIRTYTPAVYKRVSERLAALAIGIASAMSCEAEVSIQQLTPAVVNDRGVTATVGKAIAPYVAPQCILPDVKTMAAEDVALFLDRVPGCFFFVGSANAERGLHYPHHHPRFDFDERALPLGAALLASAVAAYVLPG